MPDHVITSPVMMRRSNPAPGSPRELEKLLCDLYAYVDEDRLQERILIVLEQLHQEHNTWR